MFLHRGGRDSSLRPQHGGFICVLPLSLPRAAVLSLNLTSHHLARDWQRTCGACQLLNQKFSASGSAAPPEAAKLHRRFGSDGQAGTLPRAVIVLHIRCFHSCTEQDIHQCLSHVTVLLLQFFCKGSRVSTCLGCHVQNESRIICIPTLKAVYSPNPCWKKTSLLKGTNLYLLCYIN